MPKRTLPPYRDSLAGTLLSAREAVMGPIRPILRDAGLTDQQWRVLRVLTDAGELEPMQLAAAALLYAPSVSRILRELRERGLIDRRGDHRDGRRSIISATPAGQKMVADVSARTLLKLDNYTVRFGATRLAALQRELADLVRALEPLQPKE